jgi:hypothetical protein
LRPLRAGLRLRKRVARPPRCGSSGNEGMLGTDSGARISYPARPGRLCPHFQLLCHCFTKNKISPMPGTGNRRQYRLADARWSPA